MSRILLVRHGDAVNGKGHFHGITNEPLTAAGKQEAGEVASKLEQYNPTKVVSSPVKRAVQSADIIGKYLNIPVEKADELDPLDLGEYVGKSVDDHTSEVKQYLEHPDRTIPGGESVNQWAMHYLPKLHQDLNDGNDSSHIIYLTHGRNIILSKAYQQAGSDPKRFDRNTLVSSNNNKSTEHGGYAIIDKDGFELKNPHTVKAGQS